MATQLATDTLTDAVDRWEAAYDAGDLDAGDAELAGAIPAHVEGDER